MRVALLFTLVLTVACSSGADSTSAAGEASGTTRDELAAYRPTQAQESAVVATVQVLFDALETGDEAMLRSVMDPTVVMHFSETRDGQTTFGSSTLDALAARITSSDAPLIERMWDPIVVVNGPMATLWTPYDFYAGDAFSHCGVDAVNLLDGPDGWRIVALSWTRLQPPACDLHPDGPPSA